VRVTVNDNAQDFIVLPTVSGDLENHEHFKMMDIMPQMPTFAFEAERVLNGEYVFL